MNDPRDDPPSPSASDLAWHVASALRSGDLASARRDCERALQLAQGRGQAEAVASVRTTLGRVLLSQGELSQAEQVLSEALAVHERPALRGLTLLELAEASRARGEVDEALRRLVEAVGLFARDGEAVYEGSAQLRVAAAHHAAGRLEEARRHAEVAGSVGRSAGDEGLVAGSEVRLGLLLHERGQRAAAVRLLGEAAARQHRLGALRDERYTQLARLRVSRERGDDASEAAQALVAAVAPLGDPWLLGRALCLQAAVHGAAGDRLAYSLLARADAALDRHPLLRHLPPVVQGWLDLARGERDAAMARFGRVPAEALRSVSVRLELAGLRRRLQAG